MILYETSKRGWDQMVSDTFKMDHFDAVAERFFLKDFEKIFTVAMIQRIN